MIKGFEQKGRNLWKQDKMYFRLAGLGITPNGSYRNAPVMVELKDIDIATGQDVYGGNIIHMETGSVDIYHECLNRRALNI